MASWDQALEAYLRPQGSSPPAQRGARARLAEAVQRDSGSPEAWWAFLQAEEAALAGGGAGGGGATATLTQGVAQRGGVSLFDLYLWATKQIPRQNNYSNEAYLKIWLGYARQQWCVCILRAGGSARRQPLLCLPAVQCISGSGHAIGQLYTRQD